MFDSEEYEFFLDGFIEYVTEQAKLQPSTISSYKVILNDYFENYVIGKVTKNDYEKIFNIERLSLLRRRKSNNVRPSLLHFLEFLRYEGFLKDYLCFQLQNNIKSVFVSEEPLRKKEISFLTPNEIRKLFSNKVVYKYEYEEKILPLLCALSFFYMFKQEDVIKLKMEDIDFEKNRIKNIRRLAYNSDLVEWMSINEITANYLQEYLSYRDTLHTQENALLIMNNAPLNNKKINMLFNCLNRVDNLALFEGKNIYQGLLIRSMMLYILVSTKGKGIYQILMEQETNSRAFEYAFNEYLSIIRIENKDIVSDRYNIEDILPEKRPKTIIEGAYSEGNDLNEGDIGDYDMNNIRNLELNKVSIQRMVRDSNISRRLRTMYDNECQLCGYRLRKSTGEYTSEAHHIQPYNKLHRGDDNGQNIIVLCPNCHTQFDDLYFAINPQTQEVHCIFGEEDEYHLSKLKMREQHNLNLKYLEFTWELFEEKKKKVINVSLHNKQT
ncbi:HNH endonuclease [Peribacillus sp. NPDC097895]|uniref:HNH endonuclease n=1 Tax=Peribacillus sp. NPDC097895 TaxID=3390619 RepID=UPI003CFC1FB2